MERRRDRRSRSHHSAESLQGHGTRDTRSGRVQSHSRPHGLRGETRLKAQGTSCRGLLRFQDVGHVRWHLASDLSWHWDESSAAAPVRKLRRRKSGLRSERNRFHCQLHAIRWIRKTHSRGPRQELTVLKQTSFQPTKQVSVGTRIRS